MTSPTRTTDVSIFPNTRSSIPRQSRRHHKRDASFLSAALHPPGCSQRGLRPAQSLLRSLECGPPIPAPPVLPGCSLVRDPFPTPSFCSPLGPPSGPFHSIQVTSPPPMLLSLIKAVGGQRRGPHRVKDPTQLSVTLLFVKGTDQRTPCRHCERAPEGHSEAVAGHRGHGISAARVPRSALSLLRATSKWGPAHGRVCAPTSLSRSPS